MNAVGWYFFAALVGAALIGWTAARLNRHRLPETVPSAGPDVASAVFGETTSPEFPRLGEVNPSTQGEQQ